MRIQAVVFDAFDTLFINREARWGDCFPRICKEQSLPIEPDALLQAWLSAGSECRRKTLNSEDPSITQPFITYRDLWYDSFVEAFHHLGVTGNAEEAVRYLIQDHSTRSAFPETLSVLKHLGQQVLIAVLSNADDAFLYGVLNHHGLANSFNVVLSSEEARWYKPHSEIFVRLLERLGTSPEATLMVGDNLVSDIYGSHVVGMPGAWINRYGESMDGPVKPTYELHSLEELIPIVIGESEEVCVCP